ncbi:hypothetical protein MNAN1_001057 [Malassezia nana]|uniref:Uncharacterized protein n=1 Tax=Malassezia nana TaxID=180528 RepID=A0AAF0EGM6_9BASI|nr:hypothetical protein MNAN1_001057 [Malassezia nana]
MSEASPAQAPDGALGTLPALVLTPADHHDGPEEGHDEPMQRRGSLPVLLHPAPITPFVPDIERWTPAPESPKTRTSPRFAAPPARRASPASLPPPAPLPPLPHLDKEQKEAQIKLNKVTRQKHNARAWRKWTGLKAMGSVSNSVAQLPSKLAPDGADAPAAPIRASVDVDTGTGTQVQSIGIMHANPSLENLSSVSSRDASAATGTPRPRSGSASTSPMLGGLGPSTLPSLLLEARRSIGPESTVSQRNSLVDDQFRHAMSALLDSGDSTPSAPRSPAEGLSPGPSKLDLPSSVAPLPDVSPRTSAPSLEAPRPVAPSQLLHLPWDDMPDDSDSSQDFETEALEPEVFEFMQTLSLAHGAGLTNKEKLAMMRQARKMQTDAGEDAGHRRESSFRAQWGHALRSSRSRGGDDASSGMFSMARTPSPPTDNVGTKLRSMLGTPARSDVSDARSLPNTPGRENLGAGARPRMWKRRKRRAWNEALALSDVEGDDDDEHMHARSENRVVLSPLPPDAEPEFVYDLLHENQRGMVFFGVSKRFSSNVLFLTDPAPWTDAHGVNTALNTSTFQLPDSSWEWVHPTWMVDMTGDTDEDGWQYSGSFTGLKFWRRPIAVASKPGLRRWWQQLHMSAYTRDQNHRAKQQDKEAERADEGLEAMMRSIRMRSLKWSGVPTMFTFVRRRRWVRLRRRAALVRLSDGVTLMAADGTTSVRPRKEVLDASLPEPPPLSASRDEGTAPSCSDVLLAKQRLLRLLPFFLIPPDQVSEILPPGLPPIYELDAWSRHFRLILEQETYLQNPFFALGWVHRWLARPDLASLTRDLRHQERDYQKAYQEAPWDLPPLPRKPSPGSKFDASMGPQGLRSTCSHRHIFYQHDNLPRYTPAECLLLSEAEPSKALPSIVRWAVVEHNFKMVCLLMRLCSIDRLRVDLWLMWLGLHASEDLPSGCEGDVGGPLAMLQHEWRRHREVVHRMQALGSTPAMFSPLVERILRKRIHDYTRSDAILLDVWDVIVAHLPDILDMLEQQYSRDQLLGHIRRLSETELSLEPSEANQQVCQHQGDPRWRVLRDGVVQLPVVPYL